MDMLAMWYVIWYTINVALCLVSVCIQSVTLFVVFAISSIILMISGIKHISQHTDK